MQSVLVFGIRNEGARCAIIKLEKERSHRAEFNIVDRIAFAITVLGNVVCWNSEFHFWPILFAIVRVRTIQLGLVTYMRHFTTSGNDRLNCRLLCTIEEDLSSTEIAAALKITADNVLFSWYFVLGTALLLFIKYDFRYLWWWSDFMYPFQVLVARGSSHEAESLDYDVDKTSTSTRATKHKTFNVGNWNTLFKAPESEKQSYHREPLPVHILVLFLACHQLELLLPTLYLAVV